MKPRIVEAAVKSHRVERSLGDAPTIGRVAKLGVVEASTRGERRRRRFDGRHEGEKVDLLIRLLVIAASLVGFILIGILVFFWVKSIWGGEVTAVTIDKNSVGSVVPNVVVASLPTSLDEPVALDRMSRALAVR